jgi:alpha-beta hydrolase superfamily lysophospholipase
MSKWIKGLIVVAAAVAAAAALAALVGTRPSVGDCAGSPSAAGTATWRARAADGNCLQGYAWQPAGPPVRAAIVLVHGIHDHPGRYAALAKALLARGVAVYALDQRGHGASGGARQRVDSAAQLVGDAELALAEAAQRNPGVPLFLYGHSMGGLVAAHVAAKEAMNNPAQPRLAGVVLSSAALALPPSASGGARVVVGTLSRLAPGLPLEAVDEAQVVRSDAARAELARDPAILRAKVPARTIGTILDGVVELQPLMPAIAAPLLILHGGADQITPPEGSRSLAQRAASKDKKLVIVAPALHSLLHEPEAPAVLGEIVAFIDTRAGRP